MSGSVLAQAIGLVLSPVLSRLFSPTDYGVFGSFGAVTSVMAAAATLDYSQAVMLPRQRAEAGQVFVLSCVVTLAVTLVCAGACLLFPDWILGLFKGRDSWILALVVLSVLATGLNASFGAWCVRVKAFKHTSVSQVVRGFSSNGLQVGFGLAHAGALGLVLSSVLADLLASLNLVRVMYGEARAFLAEARWQRLKQLAAEYRDFPLYSSTQNVLNALSTGLPVLLLTHFFDVAVAGGYAFGMRLINAPMSLLSGALRQVLFQKASEMQHQGRNISPLFIKSTLGLFSLGFFPALVLAVWAPELFGWVFGAKWHTAGEYARYLVFWLLLAFCNLPAVLFARLIRIQRALLVFDVILLSVRALTLVAGGLWLSALQSIALFSLVGGFMNLALIILVAHALLSKEARGGLAGIWVSLLERDS